MKPFKPMLAEDVVDFASLTYPLYGSFKVDGVCAVMPEKHLLPRSLKEFGNKPTVVAYDLYADILTGMHGELTLGKDPAPKGVRLCHLTSSALSTHDDQPDIHWWIFDLCGEAHRDLSFSDRRALLIKRFKAMPSAMKKRVHLLEQRLIRTPSEAEAFLEEALTKGYEGAMFKSPTQTYKCGRSTVKSQHNLRAKPTADCEAKIIGFVEKQKNGNEATVNKLGHKTRSSHKANKTGSDTLGALLIEIINGPFKGVTMNVGTGWTDDEALWIWRNKTKLANEIIKLNYFPFGCKDKPRHPVWNGMRAKFDMS
jgi:DNA ligase-1